MSEAEPQHGAGGMRARAMDGALWIAAATWLVRILSTVTFVFVGRHLTPAAFGLVALANAFVLLLGILTSSGFATYLVRAPRIGRRLFSTAFWTSAGIGLVLYLLLLLAAPLLSTAFREPALRDVVRWLAVVVVVNGLASAPQAMLQREFRFRQLALRTIAASVIGSVVAIVLAALGAGVWALVAQSVITACVSTIAIWAASPMRAALVFSVADMRRILGFGGQMLLTDLLLQARDRGEEFTLGLVGSATVLGQWSVASRLVKLVQDTATQVINQVSTPSLARLQGDPARLHRGYATSMAAAGALLFPVMGWFALMSRDLVPLVMGEQWRSTAAVASIIAITACFAAFTYFDRPMFAIADRLAVEIVLVVVIVVLHLAVTVLLAPWGLTALALGLLGRNVVTLPLRQWALHRFVGVPYTAVLATLRILLAAAVAVGAAALAVQGADRLLSSDAWVRLGVSAVVTALVYLVALRFWGRDTFFAFVELGGVLWGRVVGRLRVRPA